MTSSSEVATSTRTSPFYIVFFSYQYVEFNASKLNTTCFVSGEQGCNPTYSLYLHLPITYNYI